MTSGRDTNMSEAPFDLNKIYTVVCDECRLIHIIDIGKQPPKVCNRCYKTIPEKARWVDRRSGGNDE